MTKTKSIMGRLFVAALIAGTAAVVIVSAWLLWPRSLACFRENVDRTGRVEGALLPRAPVVIWSYTNVSGLHDPLYIEGTVYVGDDVGDLHAIDARTGEQLWNRQHRRGQIFTAPAVVGAHVIFTCGQGVAAVSRKDGTLVWEIDIPGGAGESSPLPLGRHVYVGGKDGKVYALESATGRTVWTYDVLSDTPAAPSPEFASSRANAGPGDKARLRIASSDGVTLYQPIFDQSRLIALDCRSGTLRWSFQAKGWIYGEPTITERNIFIGSQDNKLYCLDKATGAVVWSCATGSRIESGVAIRGTTVFFGSCDKNFYCADTQSGSIKWSCPTGGVIYSSPLVSRDTVYFGSFDGYLYALRTEDGSVEWKIQPFSGAEVASSPATDGQRIFFTTRARRTQGTNALVAVADAE